MYRGKYRDMPTTFGSRSRLPLLPGFAIEIPYVQKWRPPCPPRPRSCTTHANQITAQHSPPRQSQRLARPLPVRPPHLHLSSPTTGGRAIRHSRSSPAPARTAAGACRSPKEARPARCPGGHRRTGHLHAVGAPQPLTATPARHWPHHPSTTANRPSTTRRPQIRAVNSTGRRWGWTGPGSYGRRGCPRTCGKRGKCGMRVEVVWMSVCGGAARNFPVAACCAPTTDFHPIFHGHGLLAGRRTG